jgi:threonine aldolase
MTTRLQEDHDNARYLASRLAAIPAVQIESEPDINMVFFHFDRPVNGDSLVAYLKEKGILVNGPDNGQWRVVTHYWINRQRIDEYAAQLAAFMNKDGSGKA